MGSGNESVCDTYVFQEASSAHAEPEAVVKMAKSVGIVGIHQPEKLGEGYCPGCQTMVDLWATNRGFELSLHGKGYRLSPNLGAPTGETPANTGKEEPSARIPLVIENPKIKIYPMPSLIDFLLTPIPCTINIKRTVFFVLLSLASVALLIQIVYWFLPANMEPRIMLLDIDWAGAFKTLGFFICTLITINIIAYKVGFSDSGPDQIDRWVLVSSIVIIAYYLLSGIILPVLFLNYLRMPLF